MDLLQHLEELAVGVNRNEQEEPTPNDLARWHNLFGYSAPEAMDIITKLRTNLNTQRLSDAQWNMLKAVKEAEGYDRESYEHQLQLWSSNKSSALRAAPKPDSTSSYVFKLGGPFPDIESLQRIVGVSSAEARVGQGEEGESANFARVDGTTRIVIEKWLDSQSPPLTYRPTFVRLSQAPKDLSNNSSHPTLGIDSSLPQHRLSDTAIDHSFSPAQNEYPVWYFFYGTLTDPETLQKCISLPDLPVLRQATIKGGKLRSWRSKYKGLVDGPAEAEVKGYAYQVESVDQEDCLRFRETQNYEVVRCRVFFDEGGVGDTVQGLTFRFRNPDRLDAE